MYTVMVFEFHSPRVSTYNFGSAVVAVLAAQNMGRATNVEKASVVIEGHRYIYTTVGTKIEKTGE